MIYLNGFWHLQFKVKEDKSTTPSKAWLKENVTCATFDEDLWVLLQSKEWRTAFREAWFNACLRDCV